MRTLGLAGLGLLSICTATAVPLDDTIDRLDDVLTIRSSDATLGARISGTVDLEGYWLEQPAPGLLDTARDTLLSPRFTTFVDLQLGRSVYVFAQLRADRGFDPAADHGRLRLDEYAVSWTPWTDGRLRLQAGKFATVVGNWISRHGSWNNPFIGAPLPYENLTGIWDAVAANSTATLLRWAHLAPGPPGADSDSDKYRRLPILWGPSYASGLSVSGSLGALTYALEMKNAALASHPAAWEPGAEGWSRPAWSGRVSIRPNPQWTFGLSASTGTYLRALAEPTVAPGYRLGDYRQTVFAQDLGFAWHHFQLWAEVFEARFAIPTVGQADTVAYYVEAKLKLTSRLFVATRWNQQVFGTLVDATGKDVRWGSSTTRLDLAAGYRFNAHVQGKLQYSLQREDRHPTTENRTVSTQLTLRF